MAEYDPSAVPEDIAYLLIEFRRDPYVKADKDFGRAGDTRKSIPSIIPDWLVKPIDDSDSDRLETANKEASAAVTDRLKTAYEKVRDLFPKGKVPLQITLDGQPIDSKGFFRLMMAYRDDLNGVQESELTVLIYPVDKNGVPLLSIGKKDISYDNGAMGDLADGLDAMTTGAKGPYEVRDVGVNVSRIGAIKKGADSFINDFGRSR